MALPGVDIKFSDDNLGRVTTTEDGVVGCVAHAAAEGGFALLTPYRVRSMREVDALGLTAGVSNYHLYKALEEFYDEAGNGAELWIMGIQKETWMRDFFDDSENFLRLVRASENRISIVFTVMDIPLLDQSTFDGLDARFSEAVEFLNQSAMDALSMLNTPLLILADVYGYSGSPSELYDFREDDYGRTAGIIGSIRPRSDDGVINNGSAAHVLAGLLSKIQVHENPGKVKLGGIQSRTAFMLNTPVEQSGDISDIHDKGYITLRKHPGRSGYFFTDDTLFADPESDVNGIALRRTLDKAYRIAFRTAGREVLDDFDVTDQGTISPIYAATIEQSIETAIFNQMTAQGELSRNPIDKDDLGVRAQVDTTVNVVTGQSYSIKTAG